MLTHRAFIAFKFSVLLSSSSHHHDLKSAQMEQQCEKQRSFCLRRRVNRAIDTAEHRRAHIARAWREEKHEKRTLSYVINLNRYYLSHFVYELLSGVNRGLTTTRVLSLECAWWFWSAFVCLFRAAPSSDIRLTLVLLLYIHSLTRSLLLMTSRIRVNFYNLSLQSFRICCCL